MEDISTTRDVGPPSTTTLRGMWCIAARGVWAIFTILAISLCFAGVPTRFHQLQRPAMTVFEHNLQQLVPDEQFALLSFGMTLRGYAVFMTVVEVGFALVFFGVAIVLFWRKSDDWVVLFVSLTLTAVGATLPGLAYQLTRSYPFWGLPVNIIQAIGTGCWLILFFLFPDGRFVPRWTRWVAGLWAVQVPLWLAWPTMPTNPIYGETWLRTPVLSLMMAFVWFTSGLFAQFYRYRYVADRSQRQQTKWVVVGFSASILGSVLYYGPTAFDLASFSPLVVPFFYVFGVPVAGFLVALVPICIGASILRYRLWDIDLVITEVLVNGLLLLVCGVAWFSIQLLFSPFLGQYGQLSSIALVFLIVGSPLRGQIRAVIDQRFYPDKRMFRMACAHLADELQTFTVLSDISRCLVQRTVALTDSGFGALFLRRDQGVLVLSEVVPFASSGAMGVIWSPSVLDQLQRGCVVQMVPPFAVLLPLTGFPAADLPLVGVLALGPSRSGVGFASDVQLWLLQLARQAGVAVYAAQLIEMGREQEVFRSSPVGRAEVFVDSLFDDSADSLGLLHAHACAAVRDGYAASSLHHVPAVLVARQGLLHALFDSLSLVPDAPQGAFQRRWMGRSVDEVREGALVMGQLARVAEGFILLSRAEVSIDQVRYGLKQVVEQLFLPPLGLCAMGVVLGDGYRVCLRLLEVVHLRDIADVGGEVQVPDGLVMVFQYFQPVIACCQYYSHLETHEDRLHCLDQVHGHMSAAGALGGGVDDPLLQRCISAVIAHWLAIVQQALAGLHSEVRLVGDFVTRQVFGGAAVTLVLDVVNCGTATASSVVVELLAGAGYVVSYGVVRVACVEPGMRERCSFVAQFYGQGHCRVQFCVRYTDTGMVEQVFTEVHTVYVRSIMPLFMPIANPYVAGRPLEHDSRVFVGREDVFLFLEEALGGATCGHVLVLTGQRRMGKTSILRQVPVRLGDRVVAVYLDGQALAVDPGMPRFFTALAQRISAALCMPAPSVSLFAEQPYAGFAQVFLPQVLGVLGQRRLLLLIDEFEILEDRVRRGKLDSDVFPFLRHVMQSEAPLDFIFAGTHALDELTPDYWSLFFNVALHRRVGYLNERAAQTLVVHPVRDSLFYDDLAVDKLVRVTAGHPFFLQLLCRRVVQEANEDQRSHVVLAHINQAIDQGVGEGDGQLSDMWRLCTVSEREVLLCLLRLMLERRAVSHREVVAACAEVFQDAPQVAATALDRLVHRGILQVDPVLRPEGVRMYRWRFELLAYWLRQHG